MFRPNRHMLNQKPVGVLAMLRYRRPRVAVLLPVRHVVRGDEEIERRVLSFFANGVADYEAGEVYLQLLA